MNAYYNAEDMIGGRQKVIRTNTRKSYEEVTRKQLKANQKKPQRTQNKRIHGYDDE